MHFHLVYCAIVSFSVCMFLPGWFLCSGCSDRAQASGGRGSQGAAGVAGSTHGAPSDHVAASHQQIHGGAQASGHLLQVLPF